jgi:hypothetical protein
VSTIAVIVSVSPAVSIAMLLMVNTSQTYGAPSVIGLLQPFEKAIP